MTAIAVTAAKVAGQEDTITRSYIAAETITAGQAVYALAAGTVGVASAAASPGGKQQFFGIALEAASAGEAVLVAHEGVVEGFTVSGMNAMAPAYLSDTDGGLDTANGTMAVIVGKVIARSDATKTLYIKVAWNSVWS